MTFPQISGFENFQFVRATSTSLTWKALQGTLERTVWIRTLRPEAAPAQQDSFEAVARAFARLRHQHLIQVFDVARDERNAPYLVLEAVEGPTLAELLQRETKIDPVRAAKIGMGIAEALDAAWKQSSLIHRNLKPDNLCLTPEGIVKIVDFGAATIIQSGVDPLEHDGGLVIGTPHYMAPEQAQGLHTLDFHADMYGLGALLYHLITGAAPFTTEQDPARVMSLQIHGTLPSPREQDPRLPAAADRLLGRLLMKDPLARYDWWQDAVADLQRVSRGRNVPRDPGADPESVGTLEPYIPPHKRNRSATTTAAPGEAGATTTAPEPQGGPAAAARTTLWLLLAAGMAFLALYRWRQPEPLPAPGGRADPSDPPDLSDPPALSAEPAAPAAPPAGPLPAEDGGQPATALPPAEQPAPEPPPPAAEPSILPAALRLEVAEALRRGDVPAACKLLGDALPAAGPAGSPLREALAILSAIGNPHDLLGLHLMERHRGTTFGVAQRGRQLTVAPERYAGGLLSVQLLREDGSKLPWTLDLATLAPAERLRLLGPGYSPPAEDPAAGAAYAILALQAGDPATVQRILARIPALAPFLNPAPGP